MSRGGALLDAPAVIPPEGRARRVDLLLAVLPGVVAAGLALVAIAMRWRGSDLPAHFFRVGLVERDGFEVWNNYWFGGHHTMGYGILFPLLGAAIGIWTVAVASAAGSALLVDRLIIGATGRRRVVASLCFAVGTVTNVAIGRLPFALGLMVGLGALLAAQRRWMLVAAALCVATAAASPVVSAFLAIVFTAWALISRGEARRRFVWLTAATVVPVLVATLLYPQGGTFPFRWGALLLTLIVCAATAASVPSSQRLVRATAAVYAVTSIGTFIVASPLGANMTRLGMYAAAPVLLAVGVQRRLGAVLLPVLLIWQWTPALDAMLRAGDDPSTEAAYYRPLLRFFDRVGADTGRVEVVPTGRHWEAAFVANEVPIARGWERQLDIRFHPLFYAPGLTASDYHEWLVQTGVEYVALADAPLDDSGVAEAELIEGGLRFLRPVWRDEHWRVWQVRDSTGLVDGRAVVVEMGTDSITLEVRERGDILVRVRSSTYWASDPVRCIEPTDDGWITVIDAPVGQLVLSLEGGDLVEGDDPCDP